MGALPWFSESLAMSIGQTLRSVSSLLAGMALLMLGNGALSTTLSVSMAEAGTPAWLIGFVTAQYYVGIVLGTTVGHRVIVSVGHIRAFAAFGSTMSAATLAHAFIGDPWVWAGLRFAVGFCAVSMFMCSESWLNSKADNTTRGQVFALYQITVYLFQGLAQFLLLLPDETGFTLFALFSILMSMAIVPVAIVRTAPPELPKATRFNFLKLWRTSPTGMTTALGAGMILGATYGVGPLFAQLIGLDRGGTALFMSSVILGGLILQWPVGRFSDGRDRRLIMLAVCVGVVGAAAALMGKDIGNGSGLFALAVVFGGLAYTLYPLAVAYTNDYLPPEDLIPATGGLVMAYGIGAAIGPLVASVAVQAIGPSGLFAFHGTIAFSLGLLILLRMSKRAAPSSDDQGEFQAVPRTSPVASELDPRAEVD